MLYTFIKEKESHLINREEMRNKKTLIKRKLTMKHVNETMHESDSQQLGEKERKLFLHKIQFIHRQIN